MVELRIELPDELYERLLRDAKTPEDAARRVVQVIRETFAEREQKPSFGSIIGIAKGAPDLSESVDDALYGPLQ